MKPKNESGSRQRTETAVRESELRYRTLFDQGADGVVVFDPETLAILDFNNEACRRLGYSRKAFAKLKISDVEVIESPEETRRHALAITKGDAEVFETRQRTRHGELLDIEVRAKAIRLGDKTVVQGVWRDITERKRAEEESAELRRARDAAARRIAEDRFRILFESSRDAIMTLEPPLWRFTSGNPATVSMFQATSEQDFTAHEPWTLSPERQPDGRLSVEKAMDMIETAMREGSHFFEWRHARVGGEEFPATVLLTRVGSGAKAFLQATVRDITAQKQVEAVLQASEDKYRALIETTTTGFLILDACGRVIDANQEYVRLSGHDTLEQILGRSVVEWTAPHDLERNAREVERCAAQGFVRNLEIDYVGRGGQLIPVEINATVVGSGSSARIYSLCRDITDRKRTADELRERSRQLARLASELTVIEQRERRRLAELLHEHLQQLLVGARMAVHSLAANAGGRDREALDGLHRTLDEALASSRSITRDLAPPVSMHKDLPAAMRWLALEMRSRHRLEVSVRVGEIAAPVTEATAVLLFTAARELLLNVAKHAGCSKASLCVRQESDAVVLAVSDRGKGAAPEALRAPSSRHGFGLFSIRERTELLGGRFTVDSGPRRGMRVAVSLPMSAQVPAPAEAPRATAATAGSKRADRAGRRRRGLSVQAFPAERAPSVPVHSAPLATT